MQDAYDRDAVGVLEEVDHVRAAGDLPVPFANIFGGPAGHASLGDARARRLDVPNVSNGLVAPPAL